MVILRDLYPGIVLSHVQKRKRPMLCVCFCYVDQKLYRYCHCLWEGDCRTLFVAAKRMALYLHITDSGWDTNVLWGRPPLQMVWQNSSRCLVAEIFFLWLDKISRYRLPNSDNQLSHNILKIVKILPLFIIYMAYIFINHESSCQMLTLSMCCCGFEPQRKK